MLFHHEVLRIQGKPSDGCVHQMLAFHRLLVIGVEHDAAASMTNHELGIGEHSEILNPPLTKMIFSNVGQQHNIGFARTYTQTTAQHAAARGFEQGDIHAVIAQNRARATGPSPISLIDNFITNHQPIRR